MSYKKYCCDGSHPFKIAQCSTDETSLCADRKDAEAKMEENNALIDELQAKLYAEKKEGVIFLFQAMDAAGKDGTIRAVLSCLSPTAYTKPLSRLRAPTSLPMTFSGASSPTCRPRAKSPYSTAPIMRMC